MNIQPFADNWYAGSPIAVSGQLVDVASVASKGASTDWLMAIVIATLVCIALLVLMLVLLKIKLNLLSRFMHGIRGVLHSSNKRQRGDHNENPSGTICTSPTIGFNDLNTIKTVLRSKQSGKQAVDISNKTIKRLIERIDKAMNDAEQILQRMNGIYSDLYWFEDAIKKNKSASIVWEKIDAHNYVRQILAVFKRQTSKKELLSFDEIKFLLNLKRIEESDMSTLKTALGYNSNASDKSDFDKLTNAIKECKKLYIERLGLSAEWGIQEGTGNDVLQRLKIMNANLQIQNEIQSNTISELRAEISQLKYNERFSSPTVKERDKALRDLKEMTDKLKEAETARANIEIENKASIADFESQISQKVASLENTQSDLTNTTDKLKLLQGTVDPNCSLSELLSDIENVAKKAELGTNDGLVETLRGQYLKEIEQLKKVVIRWSDLKDKGQKPTISDGNALSEGVFDVRRKFGLSWSDGTSDSTLQGIQMKLENARRRIMNWLKTEHNLEPIIPEPGKVKFDERDHEEGEGSTTSVNDPDLNNYICILYRMGYKINGETLMKARVGRYRLTNESISKGEEEESSKQHTSTITVPPETIDKPSKVLGNEPVPVSNGAESVNEGSSTQVKTEPLTVAPVETVASTAVIVEKPEGVDKPENKDDKLNPQTGVVIDWEKALNFKKD